MTTLADDARFSRPPAAQHGWGAAEEDDEEPAFGFSSRAGRQRDKLFGDGNGWAADGSIDDDEKHDARTAAGHPGLGSDSTTVTPQHTELYAILNLETSAAPEDVLRSYRALAIAFQYVGQCLRSRT